MSSMDYNYRGSTFQTLELEPGSLPMPKAVSAKEVHQQRQKMSSQIFEDWETLRVILDRHEATIINRWTKKTKNQRTPVLTAVCPGMSAQQRPEFVACRRESTSQREAGTKLKEAYLWPYINLEDLSKPETMPLFLNSRARNLPDAFPMADKGAVHLSILFRAVVPSFLNLHTMMFTNRKTAATYGELIAWDDHNDAFHWLRSGRGLQPGEGLLVLEIQQRVLSFLVDCTKHIMHDVPAEVLVSDVYLIGDPPRVTVADEHGFASLAIMAAEAPYRVPAKLDWARLESLFAAKQSAAEDHVWALREDPRYFANVLLEEREHRPEMFKDSNGDPHPMFVTGGEDVLWQHVIGNIISDAISGLEIWNELYTQVKQLRMLQLKHADDISPERDLPEPYLDAILRFHYYLEQASRGPIQRLRFSSGPSPPLRPWFMRLPPPDATSSIIEMTRKPNLNLSRLEEDFLWFLALLCDVGYKFGLTRLTDVFDELQRLIQAEQQVKSLISAPIADAIGDLAVMAEALRQLKIYQPWSQTFDGVLVNKRDQIQAAFNEKTKDWEYVLHATEGPVETRLVQLCDPPRSKFHYPVDKRSTKANVEAMRVAEANLDVFWTAVDENTRARIGSKLEGTALGELLSQPRILQRTPPLVELEVHVTGHKVDQEVEDIRKPLSELYFDLEYRTRPAAGKGKENGSVSVQEKTRGVAAQQEQLEVLDPPPPSCLPDRQPMFHVDPRALKVFRTVFYTPSKNSTPGEVPWTDFLHAMVSVGFIPEKLYGSVWHFQPTKLDVERSIQFHEPHPSGKIPYRKARRIGRRLERAYGWFGGMFVLAEKEKGAT